RWCARPVPASPARHEIAVPSVWMPFERCSPVAGNRVPDSAGARMRTIRLTASAAARCRLAKASQPRTMDGGGRHQMQATYPRRSTHLATRSIPRFLALLTSPPTAPPHLLPPHPPLPPDPLPPPRCAPPASVPVGLFSGPLAPHPDGALRAIAVSDRRLAATLVVLAPDGRPAGATPERRGGPPYWWLVDVVPRKAGQ